MPLLPTTICFHELDIFWFTLLGMDIHIRVNCLFTELYMLRGGRAGDNSTQVNSLNNLSVLQAEWHAIDT